MIKTLSILWALLFCVVVCIFINQFSVGAELKSLKSEIVGVSQEVFDVKVQRIVDNRAAGMIIMQDDSVRIFWREREKCYVLSNVTPEDGDTAMPIYCRIVVRGLK